MKIMYSFLFEKLVTPYYHTICDFVPLSKLAGIVQSCAMLIEVIM